LKTKNRLVSASLQTSFLLGKGKQEVGNQRFGGGDKLEGKKYQGGLEKALRELLYKQKIARGKGKKRVALEKRERDVGQFPKQLGKEQGKEGRKRSNKKGIAKLFVDVRMTRGGRRGGMRHSSEHRNPGGNAFPDNDVVKVRNGPYQRGDFSKKGPSHSRHITPIKKGREIVRKEWRGERDGGCP